MLSLGTKDLKGESTEEGFVFQAQNLPWSSQNSPDKSSVLIGSEAIFLPMSPAPGVDRALPANSVSTPFSFQSGLADKVITLTGVGRWVTGNLW